MLATTKPVFGKRQAVGSPGQQRADDRHRTRPASPVDSAAPPYEEAFEAVVRQELAATRDSDVRVVPRSSRAAFLAGLVVGCSLVGFEVSGSSGAAKVATVAGLLGVSFDPANLLPALIVLGLLGGARASALTVIAVHELLRRAHQTSYLAYALGGAAASAAMAAIFSLLGHLPAHGWIIEAASGAGAGFFYRVFAGSRFPDSNR